jgi:hypothetical protein
MLIVVAFAALLGFALGLRLKAFGLMVSTSAVAFSACGIRVAGGDWTVGSLLGTMAVAATVFELCAFATMAVVGSFASRTHDETAVKPQEEDQASSLHRVTLR